MRRQGGRWRSGLTCIGLLGVLRDASFDGLLDLPAAVHALSRTNFRLTRALVDCVLRSAPPSSGRE